jgi:hypothetical protein
MLSNTITTACKDLTGFLTGLRIRIHLIRIQHFRLNPDPDPGFFMTKNKKKQMKKIEFLWIKNYNLPVPRPP